jgi:hypothetical protein
VSFIDECVVTDFDSPPIAFQREIERIDEVMLNRFTSIPLIVLADAGPV